jgi:ribonuclease HII
MGLLYTGIDEAGYGPMLGPLCIASATLRVESWSPGNPAPDVWSMLDSVVCKTKRESKSRIAVGDSKVLKLANNSMTKHPLYHLERAVLSFLSARDHESIIDDSQLMQALGATLDASPWYAGGPIPLPLGVSSDMLGIESNQLRSAMHKAGISLVDIRVRVVGEAEFNSLYTRHNTKAAATGTGLRELIERTKQYLKDGDESRIVCDRQSGRTKYAKMLGHLFDEVSIEEESPRASRYSCDRSTGVLLTPGADGAYFPVALASLAAKLVRELAMARFNRYWASQIPELKPTAGYVQDARRWLEDTRTQISDDQRTKMIRLA